MRSSDLNSCAPRRELNLASKWICESQRNYLLVVNFNQISLDVNFTILRLSREQLILDCIKIEEKYQLNAFY